MKRCILLVVISAFTFTCAEKITKPSFIHFKKENDSLYVISKNHMNCPMFFKVINKNNQSIIQIQLKPKEEEQILTYSQVETDTLSILKSYEFKGYYGDVNLKGYDTTYPYSLPFLKGYKSKIIQGYNGNFSHFGRFSSKTIDFDMKIGDTVVAVKDGVVVNKVVKYNKRGTTEDYKKYGNFLMIYHDDNTFSQYVHLKKNGNLVNVGDRVEKNQPIALSGFTGYTTVPHLHFGVYVPTENGLESVPIMFDSIPAKSLKRGDIVIQK